MEEAIENPFHSEQVAEIVGASIRQLERLFRIQLNNSPTKTYKQIRLERAGTVILETRTSMLETALACGFSNTLSMSRAFRKLYGTSSV